MARGTRAILALTGAALAFAGCWEKTPGRLRAGDAAPVNALAAGGTTAAPIMVAWAMRSADCLSCRTPAPTFRHIARRFGSDVDLVVVSVGEHPELVEGYLRSERLGGVRTVHLDSMAYAREFGASRLPAVYVISGDSVRHAWSSTNDVTAATGGSVPTLVKVLDSLVRPTVGTMRR